MNDRDRDTKLELAAKAVASAPPQAGVLVVEDDPDMQWRLARMLTVHGARVVGTSSGEGALALMAQWPADLVLVDDGLPGISGLDVARLLRQRFPGVPVVLMSSQENADLRLAARVAGAVALMAKPLRVESLLELLRRFSLMGEEAAPAGAAATSDATADEDDDGLDSGLLSPAE